MDRQNPCKPEARWGSWTQDTPKANVWAARKSGGLLVRRQSSEKQKGKSLGSPVPGPQKEDHFDFIQRPRRKQEAPGFYLVTFCYFTDLRERQQEGWCLLIKNTHLGATKERMEAGCTWSPWNRPALPWTQRWSTVGSSTCMQAYGFGTSDVIIEKRKETGVELAPS